ncbi:MAG: beta-ketoacyl-ACP synthase III [Anaerovoracaceae bacterium]
MIGRICGTGKAVPKKILTNDDLTKIIDTSDEWIKERTGISQRHIIQDETTTSLAQEAAKQALNNSGLNGEDIDMIIVATVTPDVLVPSVACYVQEFIGAKNSFCLDINAACVGFLMAFNMAQNAIASGTCKNALVIGAESLSTIVNWEDRSSCTLFGDGAGAAVLKGEEGDSPISLMYTDGSRGDFLKCETRRQSNWQEREELKATYLSMGGQDVFRFATKEVPKSIYNVLDKAGVSADDIDYFVLHQANKRIVETIARRMRLDLDKFPMNIGTYGNTSSASIPLLLADMDLNGQIKKGMKLVIAGFGGGLTWGASYVEI